MLIPTYHTREISDFPIKFASLIENDGVRTEFEGEWGSQIVTGFRGKLYHFLEAQDFFEAVALFSLFLDAGFN